jgi:hypothetical protein
MTKSMTGSFYLTESITLPAASVNGTRVQGTIDLGAYVNVPTGQAVAIESVDFIWQRQEAAGIVMTLDAFLAGNGTLGSQLTDLNPASLFVRADNQSLVASGALNIDDANNISSQFSDLFPDNHGPTALSEAFLVVNDQLYLVGGNDASAVGTGDLYCTVRIKCRVVKLSTKDWMAIAIQSTAADN